MILTVSLLTLATIAMIKTGRTVMQNYSLFNKNTT